jgi:PRTRC genetic system ThiF family protein
MNSFNPHVYLKRISIVGVGGTGAQVARIVGRILYDMKQRRQHVPQLLLVDPDLIEAKNVGRQLFSHAQIGIPKAQAVSTMLNLALGLNSQYMVKLIDAKDFDRFGSELVISCVDNHLARQEIHRIQGLHIDAGNGLDFGQVVVGNVDDADLMQRHLDGRDGSYRYLPKPALLLPELLEPDDTPQPELSCAEHIQTAEQHLLVNDVMANIVGQYVYKILHRQPVTNFMTVVNTTHLVMTSKPISRAELEVYLNP